MRSSFYFLPTVLLALLAFQVSAILIEPIAAQAQEANYIDDYPLPEPEPKRTTEPKLAPVVPAASTAETIWDHNGSKITWASNGNARTATFLEPREGLSSAGVFPGTVLFKGERRGNKITGTAYSFKAGCSPTPYKVEATIRSEKEFLLEGPAPVFESDSCAVARYDNELRSASLRLTLIESDASATRAATAAPSPVPAPAQNSNDAVASNTSQHKLVSRRVELKVPWSDNRSINFEMVFPESAQFHPFSEGSELNFWAKGAMPDIGGVSVDRDLADVRTEPIVDQECEYASEGEKAVRRTQNQLGRCITLYEDSRRVGARKLVARYLIDFFVEDGSPRSVLVELSLMYVPKTEEDQRLGPDVMLQSFHAAFEERRQKAVALWKEYKEQKVAAEERAAKDHADTMARLEKEREELAEHRREAEREQANRVDPYTMVWRIKSSYQYKAQVAFYSDVRQHAWPDFGKAWDLDDSQVHTFRLACQRGEKICYGAWATGNSRVYWGVGLRKENSCTGCCYTCGSIAGIELIDGGNGNGEARGITAEDLLGAAVGIGIGAAIAGARGGGGGGVVRTAPRPAPYTTRSPADLEESTITGRRR